MNQDIQRAKDELIAAYLENREAFLAAAQALPPESHSTAFAGEWTVRELLAHMCGWDHTYRAAFDQILAGELPNFFDEYDLNWQRFNYRLVARYRQHDLAVMIARVRDSQSRLSGFLQSLPAEVIFADCGICTENGFQVTISNLMQSLTREEHEHLQQILNFRRSLEAASQQETSAG